jgi:IPT/TIG domain
MKNSVLVTALLLATALAAPLRAQETMPLVTAVDPGSGTYGDVITVTGDNLDQARVAALYLTDGKKDIKLGITEQTATSVKFQVPAGIATGRFALMVLTTGKDAKLIEEPVKLTIEPPAAKTTS